MNTKLQSQPILEALKSKLKCPIRYFCQVTHVGINKGTVFQDAIIFCLGEHSMFLLDHNMERVLGEIFYAHIIQVVEQESSNKNQLDVMRIEINEDRPQGIPAKITVISSEKNVLLKHLRCYWETDYMWRLSKYAVLRVDKEQIDLKKYKARPVNTTDKESYALCSNSSQKYTQKGYTYFIPDYLNKDQRLIGEFNGEKEGEKYFLKVVIEDSLQIENIKDDLRSKTEALAEAEIEGDENYCFVKNAPYMRKMNIVIDWASWKGWTVVMKTSKNRFISVIVLRRKFIPPLVDSGQDFVFTAKGGKAAFSISSDPADTIFTIALTSELYSEILIKRCDALIMDEETADFYRVQLKIEPRDKSFAYMFIYSLLKIINSDNRVPDQQKLISEIQKKNEYSEALAKLNPCEVIEEFAQIYKGTNPKGQIKWKEKVCRYLAYAVDGGLFQSRFTLEDVIKCAKDGSLRDISQLSILKRCIKLLLHIRKFGEIDTEKNATNNNTEDLYEPISNLLKDCKNKRVDKKRWVFNEKVMTCLIETSYLQRELDISGDINVYPSLLIHLLQSPFISIELKSAICRVTVNIDEASDINTFKQMIPHFLKIFKDRNYQLATQAAISLINLTNANRENKQTIFKERKIIISRLTTKDHKLLSYTVSILNNLATETARRKVIANDIREPLCKILTGEVIETGYLTPEVLNNVFLALITITSKDHTSADLVAANEDLLTSCDYYLKRFDDEVPNLFWFFEILAEKSTVNRNKLGAKLLPTLVDKLKLTNNQETAKSILMLVKGLVYSTENFQLCKTLNLQEYLRKMIVNPEGVDSACIKIAKYILRIDRQ